MYETTKRFALLKQNMKKSPEIRRMPNLTKIVLNRCTRQTNIKNTHFFLDSDVSQKIPHTFLNPSHNFLYAQESKNSVL